jgi:hypothetical protein
MWLHDIQFCQNIDFEIILNEIQNFDIKLIVENARNKNADTQYNCPVFQHLQARWIYKERCEIRGFRRVAQFYFFNYSV